MSDTPETDALREAIDNGAAVEAEMTSLAMKLERERDEAREERDKLKQLLAADSENVDAYLGVCTERDEAKVAIRALAEHGESEIQRITKERDEARNKMADALQELDLRTLDYERIKQERDEAREKYATEATEHMLAINKLCNERDEAITTIEDAKRALKATDYEGILLAAMRVKEERDEAREALREIAEASGFDNIGNWARNKAKSALYR